MNLKKGKLLTARTKGMLFFQLLHIYQYLKNSMINKLPANLKNPNPNKKIIHSLRNACFLKRKLFIKKAIGVSENIEKRAVPLSLTCQGSFTVEAALIAPIFMGMILTFFCIFQVMMKVERVNTVLCATGRQLASYSLAEQTDHLSMIYGIFMLKAQAYQLNPQHIILQIETDQDDEGLKYLKAHYSMRIQSLIIPDRTVIIHDQIAFRTWTGDLSNAGERGLNETSDQRYVYVTSYGSVYHQKQSCSFLDLSIRQIFMHQVEHLRNKDGERYQPCERCAQSARTVIYITDYGHTWHVDKQCSSLKRTISIITEMMAKKQGLESCHKCGDE